MSAAQQLEEQEQRQGEEAAAAVATAEAESTQDFHVEFPVGYYGGGHVNINIGGGVLVRVPDGVGAGDLSRVRVSREVAVRATAAA